MQFASSDYSVHESDGHVEVCLVLDGMAHFPISFSISSGENNPSDAEGQCAMNLDDMEQQYQSSP